MVRPLRIEFPNAWYHVTCRGNEQSPIFRDDRDRRRFLSMLRQSIESYNVEIHCLVLMINHFHLLLKTLTANLNRFMQRFNTAYTTYFNLRHDRKGHLYQGRYKAIVVEADEYLLELSRYIHLNPLRIKKYRDKPLEEKIRILNSYAWSSFPGYVKLKSRFPFVSHEQVLSYMGGDNRSGRTRYKNFVLAGLTGQLDNPLEEAQGNTILGTEVFGDWIRKHFIEPQKPKPEDYGRLDAIVEPIPVEEIALAVAKDYDVSPEVILRRRSPFSEARMLLIALSHRLNVNRRNLRELGRDLGGISGAHVAHVNNQVRARLQFDRKLEQRYTRLIQMYKHHI